MNFRRLFFLAFFIISAFHVSLFPVKKIVIDNVFNPIFISVIKNRLFIGERTRIFVYSLPDVRFIKTIGSRGAGPGEYLYIMNVNSTSTGIRVSDLMKICFYDPDLNYLRETRLPNIGFYIPFGDQYIGEAKIYIDNKVYETINFYDSNFKRGKEIYRYSKVNQPDKEYNLFSPSPTYFVQNDQILIEGEDQKIHIYDRSGNPVRSITVDTPRVKITDSFKQKYLEDLKNDKEMRAAFAVLKDKLRFPDYFPLIASYRIIDDNLYIITYSKTNKGRECFILNFSGKLLKKIYLPLQYKEDGFSPYSYDLKKDKLYQLVEDVENENFVLYITDI